MTPASTLTQSAAPKKTADEPTPQASHRVPPDDARTGVSARGVDAAGVGLRGSVPVRTPRLGATPSPSSNASVMNSHLSFDGELRYAGSVTVDCEFRGSIVTDDAILVGPAGRVEAEIKAGVVEISGKVRGNVVARQRVKIHTGGEVYGNIETPTISMEEGVVFEGHCTRPSTPVPTPTPAAATAAAPSAPASASSAIQQVLEGAAGHVQG